MKNSLSTEALAQVFSEARTHHFWKDETVSDDAIKQLYDVFKWAPTANNAQPTRLLFLKSEEAKEKLYPSLFGKNPEQVKASPLTVIVGHDLEFHNNLNRLFTAFDAAEMYANNKSLAAETAFRNSSLQGAYLILAARALGFDVGPMSGFDNEKVDETFFANTSIKSNFIMNIGYGVEEKTFPRALRLDFDETSKII